MTFDVPHMIATAAIILVVSWLMQQSEAVQAMGRGRRILLPFLAIFIPLFILNLVWAYGSGA